MPPEKDLTQSLYIQCGDQVIGKITAASSQKLSSEWVVYYTVKSIEHKVQHAQTLGAQCISDIQEVPNIGKAATLTDSASIDFGLFEYTD